MVRFLKATSNRDNEARAPHEQYVTVEETTRRLRRKGKRVVEGGDGRESDMNNREEEGFRAVLTCHQKKAKRESVTPLSDTIEIYRDGCNHWSPTEGIRFTCRNVTLSMSGLSSIEVMYSLIFTHAYEFYSFT